MLPVYLCQLLKTIYSSSKAGYTKSITLESGLKKGMGEDKYLSTKTQLWQSPITGGQLIRLWKYLQVRSKQGLRCLRGVQCSAKKVAVIITI